jgi:hypothetical protein
MDIDQILEYYSNNKQKGRYQVAKELNINKNTFCSLIDKHFPNTEEINISLEQSVLDLIKKYPYTGTKLKIAKILNVSKHSIDQIVLKTDNKNIKDHFNKILYSAKNITDSDIVKILEGSKKGIGNDLMGNIIGVDGATIRYIRKKFLTEEEYSRYHSSTKFLSPWSKGYTNNRGDIFLSSLEEKVCDFLHEKNINYKSNITLNYQNKNYSPDIHLIDNNVFIEIFGMSNVDCYKHRMYEKIKFYTENKIKCLFLFQESFYDNLDWKEKIIMFIEEIKNKKYNKQLTEKNYGQF